MQFMRSQRVGRDLATEQQHRITIVTLVTSKIKHLPNAFLRFCLKSFRQEVESARWLLIVTQDGLPWLLSW